MKRGGPAEPPRRGRVRRRASGPPTGLQTTEASQGRGRHQGGGGGRHPNHQVLVLGPCQDQVYTCGRVERELHVRFLRELGGYPRQFSPYRVGRQPPVTAVSLSSWVPPHVSLGWNCRTFNGHPTPRGSARPPGRPSGLNRLGTPKTRSGPAIRPPSHPWAEWGLKFRPLASLISHLISSQLLQ